MPSATKPRFTPGRVYRTKDLGRWGQNPTRLAKRLVRADELVELRHGLFYRPKQSRFGAVPPEDGELMRAFLQNSAFAFTGPTYWNALGLGSTALFAHQLVYNTKRSGVFSFGNRTYRLRRVRFPRRRTREWFVVDLFENHAMAGVGLDELERRLKKAVRAGRFDVDGLFRAARRFGTKETQAAVSRAIAAGDAA